MQCLYAVCTKAHTAGVNVDIVDQLRQGPSTDYEINVDMFDEAVKEIERLREQVEWLKPFAARGLGDAFEEGEWP